MTVGFERKYLCYCPECGKEKQSRKRDMGKLCASCNMKTIEKNFRYKRETGRKTSAEYSKTAREKYKTNDKYRLGLLLQQARVRSKKRGLICDLTIKDLLSIFPENRLCPVLGIELYWGTNGKGDRKHSPSLDRLDPKGNYTKENVVIISWRANEIKGDASIDEMEAVLEYMKG
jgi:hypothetical protein